MYVYIYKNLEINKFNDIYIYNHPELHTYYVLYIYICTRVNTQTQRIGLPS